MEEQVINFIRGMVESNVTISYLVFFASSFLQIVFPPYPGDSITIFSGYVTAVSSRFALVPVVINSMVGTVMGSLLVYHFGRMNGENVLNYKWVKRFLPERKRRKATRLFKKYGAGAVFLSKFIPGANTLIILFSGMFKVKRYIVYLSILAAAMVHNTILVLLGKFLGHNMVFIEKLIKTYNILVVCLIILIGLVVFFFYRNRRKAM